MTCTFFGHRDCREDIKNQLTGIIVELILKRNVDKFLVGNSGNFDMMVISVLKGLKLIYTHIDFCVVLAYLNEKGEYDCSTVFPEGIETIPKRYAIPYRNTYMIENSDFVVGYITHKFGGSYNYYTLAEKRRKICINLAKT